MARLCSIATGNFLTAGTWGTLDTTSYLNSETGTTNCPNAAGASARSAAFTPGAITIDAIGVKLGGRLGTTGTMTVELYNSTAGAVVAGTTVTINTADLKAATTANVDGGWIVFKFAAPVLLLAATNYMVQCFTSSSSQVSLYRDATANNWSRFLRTTTTAAPGAGDDMVVAGEFTGAGTSNDYTVTMNETAATDYGAASTSAVTPAIAVCDGGTFEWASGSAANPRLRVSGFIITYNGGTVNIGTTGTPIPRDSVAILEFDCAADGDFGLIVRNGGTLNMQGLSRTSGKDVFKCLLNTDESAGSTNLGVDTDTGWLSGDQIAVASTTRTNSQCETGTLSSDATATALPVTNFIVAAAGNGVPPTSGSALINAHSGTSPTQAEVILLTRNVRYRSVSSTAMSFLQLQAGTTADIDWCQFYYIGENVTSRRGIEIAASSASNVNIQYSSIHDCEDFGFTQVGGTIGTTVFSNNVMWCCGTILGPAFNISTSITGTFTANNNVVMRTLNGNCFTLSGVTNVTLTNNTAVGAASSGTAYGETSGVLGTVSGNVSHSNSNVGFQYTGTAIGGTSTDDTSWRNSGAGYEFLGSPAFLKLSSPVAFGNTTNNFNYTAPGGSVRLISPVANGDTTFATTNGLGLNSLGQSPVIIIDDADFSTVSGIKTAHTQDINVAATSNASQIILRNNKLGAATEVASQTNLADLGYVSAERLDQTDDNHKTWMRRGTLQTDATIFNTAAPSQRCTPNNASNKLESAPLFRGKVAPVDDGGTVTVSVAVRKSAAGDGAAYNGNQPRLIVRANPAMGIASDTVLDTMTVAVGNWETLSGTTAAVTDDGMLEFIVDCDGTAGWINVDDWAAS